MRIPTTHINRRFLRHYLDMVVIMFLGMAVLWIPTEAALAAIGGVEDLHDDAPALMLLAMAFSMTVPMVAWMRLKHHHGWPASLEMAASMVVPTLAAIAAHAAGADFDTVLGAEHVVMLAAMFGVMLLRRDEYSRAHGHASAA